MLDYYKGNLLYKIYEDEEVLCSNSDDTFSIALFPSVAPDLFINFKPLSTRKSNIIFLCPGDILFSKSKIRTCKIIGFKKGSIPTSENLIYLLFNTSIRETKQSTSIHELNSSNSPTILELFSKLQALFVDFHYDEKMALCHINDVIYDCVFNTLFGDHKSTIAFLTLLNSDYKKKHLVSDYADIIKMPPKELLRSFRRRNYEKPSEIIKERILLEIKKLLITTDLDVKEIAMDVGFEDPAYFARFFKKNTGITASEFKKQHLDKK